MRRTLASVVFSVILSLSVSASVVRAQNAAVTIDVDAAVGRHPIDPRIYGLAYATRAELSDLRVPLNRLGGNNTSRYNWQLNADNRGFDWYFESVPYGSAVAGEAGDTFIADAKASGAEAMVTIPMVGWVGKLGTNRTKKASFSIAKYGAQTGNDWQWYADAGNGISSATGQPITGNDPNDANVPAGAVFQQGWMQHIVGKWGSASEGGLRYYILDNEPSIWHSTHRDVHPAGATMEEVRDKMIDTAARVKALDPQAVVVGPEEWGWSGYFWSGYDQQWYATHGWNNGVFPDKSAHGSMDYLPWLLAEMRAREIATGTRLLDVFTVHYYPQGGEFSDDVSTAMQLRRNRSTRSLWDPTYVDESWIADDVRLVLRLHGWVDAHYPGTAIGITEYNWGAEGHINGATTQADILGIFGREGVDLAARWTTPAASTPTYKAIKMYRNVDGTGGAFGDVSVRATAPNPDQVSAFAAERTSDGAVTVMVISKVLTGTTPATVRIANAATASPAQAWRLTSTNAITRLADVPVSAGAIALSLPPQSVTLVVVPAATEPPPPPPPPPSVELRFRSSTYVVTEKGRQARIDVERVGSSEGTATVTFATGGGTATPGSDYQATTTVLTFAPGTGRLQVNVPIVHDRRAEPSETVGLTLSAPTGGAVLGTPATATLTIREAK